MLSLKLILVLPSLDPEGVEVKLWFEREPEKGTAVSLSVGDQNASLPFGERLFLALPGAPRWTPETPNLLTLNLAVAGEEHTVRFGLRQVTARGEKLFLNGEPFYARGFGCDGDKCGSLARQVETPRGYRNYVARAKEFGFNTMRLHKIWENDAPEEFLQACDELGLFMWPEFRIDPKTFRAYASVVAERPNPRPSPEAGWDSAGFYFDREANGRNKFDDRGETMPIVDAPLGI